MGNNLNGTPAGDVLDEERQVLRAKDARLGPAVIAIVESIRVHGYVKTALDVGAGRSHSYADLYVADNFSRRLAPEHHRRVEGLLALLAVAVEEDDRRFAGRFNTRELAQLHDIYRRHVDGEQREWARRQLSQPAAQQLGLL